MDLAVELDLGPSDPAVVCNDLIGNACKVGRYSYKVNRYQPMSQVLSTWSVVEGKGWGSSPSGGHR